MNPTPIPDPIIRRALLLDALGASDGDLVANRAGVLSPAQQARLRGDIQSSLGLEGYVATALFAIIGISIVAVSESRAGFSLESLAASCAVGVLGGLGITLFLALFTIPFVSRPAFRAADNLGQARVYMADGTVRDLVRNRYRVHYCMVDIGPMKFYVRDERALRAFQVGQPYRFYYITHFGGPALVAAEPILTV